MSDYVEMFRNRWFWGFVGLLTIWMLFSEWYSGYSIGLITLIEAVVSGTMITWFISTLFYVFRKITGKKTNR